MENQAWEMKGPSEKHLCSLEIELGSLSPSHLPTAFQGQGAFLGVNERFLRIPLLSEATFEGARGPDKLCLPAQYMYVPGPRKKGIPPRPIVPPHHPSPHPTPPLPGGLVSSPRGGGKEPPWPRALGSLSTGSLEFRSVCPHALLGCFPSPSAFCALQGQGQYWGCFSQECRDILPKYTETVLGLLNEPSHTQRTKKLRCQAWSLR